MKNLTNVSVEYTGGNNWVYQAMYKGKCWLYGNLSGCLSAYSYEPFKYMEENDCGDAPEEYAVIGTTDFPTWGSILRSIVEQGEYSRQYVLEEMMYWNTNLRKRVNEE